MSADRELLELAAKAVELPECGWMGPAFMYVKDNTFTDWNPLTDDGDALRLAVKLGILNLDDALFYGDRTIDFQDDPCAATRRAIVKVAAEIAKAAGDTA